MPLPNNTKLSEIELVQVFFVEQVNNVRRVLRSVVTTVSRLKETIQPAE